MGRGRNVKKKSSCCLFAKWGHIEDSASKLHAGWGESSHSRHQSIQELWSWTSQPTELWANNFLLEATQVIVFLYGSMGWLNMSCNKCFLWSIMKKHLTPFLQTLSESRDYEFTAMLSLNQCPVPWSTFNTWLLHNIILTIYRYIKIFFIFFFLWKYSESKSLKSLYYLSSSLNYFRYS